MQNTEFCKHYRAMSEFSTCLAGIEYQFFKGLKFVDERPCFERNGVAPSGCQHAEFPTAEEREQRNKEIVQQWKNIGAARNAIVDHLGGPWKRGMVNTNGIIDCPVCGEIKSLRFSRSGYNGHIYATCDTKDCVQWME